MVTPDNDDQRTESLYDSSSTPPWHPGSSVDFPPLSGVPFYLPNLIAAIVASVGIIIGSIGTWAVAEVFALLTIRSSALGGGTGTNVPSLDNIGPVELSAYTYWAALAVAVVTLIGSYLLLRSRVGIAIQAIRDNEEAAAAIGVRVLATGSYVPDGVVTNEHLHQRLGEQLPLRRG